MSNLLLALWFFWPAAAGNGSAVVADRVPLLKKLETPMDFGLKHRGKRIFGDNKTWRGFIFGTFVACFAAAVQYYIWLPPAFAGKSLGFMVLLGGVLGAGALIGDAVESFIKRQLDIDSGNSWFPFDQLDYILGGVLLSSLLIKMPWQVYGWVFVLYFGIHLLSTWFFYKVGIRKKPI